MKILGLVLVFALSLVFFNWLKNKDNSTIGKINIDTKVGVSFSVPAKYTDEMIINNLDKRLSIRPLEAQAAEIQEEGNNIIKYIDAYKNTDVVQTKYNNKLKEDIFLKRPGHPEKFEYEINTNDYNIEKDEEGNLFFVPKVQGKKDHKTVIEIPAPFLIDSQGRESSVNDVQMSVVGDLLIIIPNADWLESHPYPIILDPSFEVKDEILSKRTINSKTYSLGDNRFRAISYLDAVHYKNEAGEWEDIITDIESGSDETGFGWQNINNNYKSYFRDSSLGEYLKFKVDNAWIQYELMDNSDLGIVNTVVPVVESNSIVYADIYSGVDLKYTVFPDKLLEEYIVAATSIARQINELGQKFIFQGVYFEEQTDGSVDFRDIATDKVLWSLPIPVMYELDDQTVSNYDLHYEITQVDEVYIIKKVLDPAGKEWLVDSSRVYPVVIDASAGPNSPGTMSTDSASGGTTDWTLPDNAKLDDGVWTAATVGSLFSFCLSPDTLVATENGNKAIEDLKEGEMVYSYNEELGIVELKEASNIIHRSIISYGNKYYNIYFGESNLKATYNHMVYANDEWVMVENLKVGDELLDIYGDSQIITNIIIEENIVDDVWDISVQDNRNFFAEGVLVHNSGVYDHRVRIIKGGSVGTTDRADGSAWPGSYVSHGGATDLWGETWTYSDINASTFGVAISAIGSGYQTNNTSYYLQATNFGFSIPSGSTIAGITAEIEKSWTSQPSGPVMLYKAIIDHIRITIDYTEGGGGGEPSNPGVTIEGEVIEFQGSTFFIE